MKRDLRPLFNPRSLAVLGASNDPAKWGHAIARNAMKGEHRRQIYFVNRKGENILGRRSYRTLLDLPESPELVVITIRPDAFEAAVDDALRVGARALVVITAGLGERDEAGLKIQQAAVERCRLSGTVLVGPNCLGIADSTTDLDLTWGDFRRGEVAFVSQSGNIGLELTQLAPQFGVGFSRFISLGNQADLNAAESIEDLLDHDGTRVIAVYLEDFEDGRHFASVAERATRAGKPVILLTVGTTAASRRMAHSHTGALVSDSLAVDAACAASGIYRVETPLQMVDLAQMLLMPHPPSGPRIAIVGDGGGHVALAADRLAVYGLRVEPFSEGVSGRLAGALAPTATPQNPVDVAGGGEEDVWSFERAVRLIAESGEADAVMLTGYFGGYSAEGGAWADQETDVAIAMTETVGKAGVPLMVQTMYPRSPTALKFRQLGVPVYADIEALARALGKVASPRQAPSSPHEQEKGHEFPPHWPGVEATGSEYFAVRRLLEQAGIPFAESRPARTKEEALTAARAIGYPVVLKALGTTHKTDVGGVRLAIASDAALLEDFRQLQSRLHPPLFAVEREAPIELGVELLIGIKRDRSFGPIALVGLGGLHAEVFKDVAVTLAPLPADRAAQLIRSLRGSELLTGWRGRAALDVEAAADVLSRLSLLAWERPDISEIEINPLLVLSRGVQALDARMMRDMPQSSSP